jgi:hypothetical protein
MRQRKRISPAEPVVREQQRARTSLLDSVQTGAGGDLGHLHRQRVRASSDGIAKIWKLMYESAK